jgi:FkbM family methyltransferase
MTFISYAQNYEDVMLRRAFKDVKAGIYIDVGANDPVIHSVTKAFYDAGWRGINIDPVSEWFEKLQYDRLHDINLQLAVGADKGEVDFFEVVGTGLSTLDESIAKKHVQEHGFELKSYEIPVVTLTSICEQYPYPEIHFLKIDVEGGESCVLQGLDLKKIRPWVILVESTLPLTQIESYKGWEHFLTGAGYHFVYFDGINRYYVANEHSDLDTAFVIPPNYFDSFKCATEDWLERHSQRLSHDLDVSQQDCKGFEVQVQSLQSEITQYDKRLYEKETKQQELLLVMIEKDVKQNGLLLSMIEKENQLIKAARELGNSKSEVDRLQSVLLENKSQQRISEAALREEEFKVDKLNQISHHWWVVAENLKQELGAVYKSKSWAITLPLRKFNQVLKLVFHFPVVFVFWLTTLPRSMARWLLIKIVGFTLKHPSLKCKIMSWLHKYPLFRIRLRNLAQAEGLIVLEGNAELRVQPPLYLSDDTIQIYEELKEAIAKRHQENM